LWKIGLGRWFEHVERRPVNSVAWRVDKMEDRWIDLEKLLETINIKKDLEIDELD